MNDYLIYTDSAADFPTAECDKRGIKIIPMDYTVNGEERTYYTNAPDREKICDDLYALMRQGADVHTSQITPYRYTQTWEPELQAGHDILYVCFSSGLSATYENAVSAVASLKEDYPERTILVVDSLAATFGQGVFTVAACLNRDKGMSLEENANWLEENKKYLCHRFCVGDLDYLHKGGRVSAATALVGGMLKIKPLLVIDAEGKLQVVQKARGLAGAKKALVKAWVHEWGVEGVPEIVYIGHSSLYEEAEQLKQMLQQELGDGVLIETMNESPIIGVHTGPEFFAICGFGKHRVSDL